MNTYLEANEQFKIENLSDQEVVQEEIDSLVHANLIAGDEIQRLQVEVIVCQERIKQRARRINRLKQQLRQDYLGQYEVPRSE